MPEDKPGAQAGPEGQDTAARAGMEMEPPAQALQVLETSAAGL